MNSPLEIFAGLDRRFARFTFIVMAVCSLAANGEDLTHLPSKTHRLFMGSNLSIVSKDSLLPVRDVRDNSFVVNGSQGVMVIPPQDSQFQLKIDDALKLTTAFAMIDQLTFDRTYTGHNDPMRKFADAARVSAYMEGAADDALAGLRDAQSLLGSATAAVETAGSGPAAGQAAPLKATADQGVTRAQSEFDRSQAFSRGDIFSSTSNISRLSSDLAAEAYDALRVTFKISSPKPLTTPYVVIFMRFFEEKGRPKTANVWIYAEKLGDIDERPRSVTILRGGFPPGYHIESYHLHLYEGTSEIATSVSRKQMALTTDEAFEYSVIQHIGENRDQTMAPGKAKFFWPENAATYVLPDKLMRTVFVKVGKNGRALGIFEDEACKKPVSDAQLTEMIPELRFYPALEKGKPVEGIAAVKLGLRE